MPLLGKELAEQAARRGTYVVRVVYALLLFLASAILLHDVLPATGSYNAWQLMGSGRRILEPLVIMQFFGICLFLPAMMAGTIAGEKEQDSLALLFLTDMGPWEILLQKYLGRLIPMFNFLLLSLPVMAVAYALGGLESRYVTIACWMLFLSCLQVGAFALMCSAICRTTVSAFMSSYLGLAALWLLPALTLAFGVFGHSVTAEKFLLCLIPPAVLLDRGPQASFGDVLLPSLPILLSVSLFLQLARVFLVRRAFAPAQSPLLALFRRMDRVFKRWNDRVGGIVVGQVADVLPENEPVAWRELHKRSMGKLHYLVRLGLLIEVPVLFIGVFALSEPAAHETLSMLACLIWALAALLLAVQGANTIVAERTRQTLEVLLTTPLWGDDIVRQKMRAIYRLCILFAVPLLTLMAMGSIGQAFHSYRSYYSGYSGDEQGVGVYLVSSLLCIGIYLPLLAWFSLWVGLRVRTRGRAIMASLVALAAWCLAAPVLLLVLGACGMVEMSSSGGFPNCLLLLSPAVGVAATEFGWGGHSGLFEGWGVGAMIFNFVLYGAILFRLRYLCLRDADRLLRRE